MCGVYLLLYLRRDSGEHIPPKLVNKVTEGEKGNPLESHIKQNIDICFMVIDVDVRAKQAKPLEISGSAHSQGENIRHTLLYDKSYEYRQSRTLI